MTELADCDIRFGSIRDGTHDLYEQDLKSVVAAHAVGQAGGVTGAM